MGFYLPYESRQQRVNVVVVFGGFATSVLLFDKRAQPVQQELFVVAFEHELLAQHSDHFLVGRHHGVIIVDDAQQDENQREYEIHAGQYLVTGDHPRGYGMREIGDHPPDGREPLERAAGPGRGYFRHCCRPRGRAEDARHEQHGHDHGVRPRRAVHVLREAVVDDAREPLDVEHDDQRDEPGGRQQSHVEAAQPHDRLDVDDVQHVFGQVQLLFAHHLEQVVLEVSDQYAPGTANQYGYADFASHVHDQQFVHDLAHVRLPAQRRVTQRAGALGLLPRAVYQPVNRTQQHDQQRQFHVNYAQYAQPSLLVHGPVLEFQKNVENYRQHYVVERHSHGSSEFQQERPHERLLLLQQFYGIVKNQIDRKTRRPDQRHYQKRNEQPH